MGEIKKIFPKGFRHNFVMPMIYDDAISYPELLYRMARKLNEVIRALNGDSDVEPFEPPTAESFELETYANHRRYYLKCDTGNDDNDGLTPNTAWKTLDHLFEQINNGLVDARCYFAEPGNYYIKRQFIANAVLHLAPMVEGVNIIFDYEDNEAFYFQNCHVKFGRTDEDAGGIYPLHLYPKDGLGITAEGGEMAFYRTFIHDKYYQFGGYVFSSNSGAEWYRFAATTGTLESPTVLNTNPEQVAFYMLRGANIYFTGDIYLAELTQAGSNNRSTVFHVAQGSSCYLNCNLPNNYRQYYYALYILGSNVYTFSGRVIKRIVNKTVSKKIAMNIMSNIFANSDAPAVYGGDEEVEALIEDVTV